MLDIIASLESEVRSYVRKFPAVFRSAEGAWITDIEGQRYLDFFAGAGTLNYGHNNPLARQALLDYIAANGIQHSLDLATEAKALFLRDFHEIILQPRDLDYKIQMTGPTGTNAVEAAIKLARKVKQRSHVIAFTGAYHGNTLGALALTADRHYHHPFSGAAMNVTHLPYDGFLGDFETTKLLEKMLSHAGSGLPQPAAVIVETIQAQGGINVASPQWLRRVEAICRRYDLLLIVDDIQTGNGRTGDFFSFEQSGIRPDLVCLSKSLGGGMPLAMVLIDPKIDSWKPAEHTGTFRGNNLAFVAGRALLSYWRDRSLATSIAAHSRIIQDTLEQWKTQWNQPQWRLRGRGMLWGLDLVDGAFASEVVRRAFDAGLIIETSGIDGEVLKFLPPLTITHDDLQTGLARLGEALAASIRHPIAPWLTDPSLSLGATSALSHDA